MVEDRPHNGNSHHFMDIKIIDASDDFDRSQKAVSAGKF